MALHGTASVVDTHARGKKEETGVLRRIEEEKVTRPFTGSMHIVLLLLLLKKVRYATDRLARAVATHF